MTIFSETVIVVVEKAGELVGAPSEFNEIEEFFLWILWLFLCLVIFSPLIVLALLIASLPGVGVCASLWKFGAFDNLSQSQMDILTWPLIVFSSGILFGVFYLVSGSLRRTIDIYGGLILLVIAWIISIILFQAA